MGMKNYSLNFKDIEDTEASRYDIIDLYLNNADISLSRAILVLYYASTLL